MNILEINLSELERDENLKYSDVSLFPKELQELHMLAIERDIRINFIHNYLELKTRDYTKKSKTHDFETYDITVLNIYRELPIDEYYNILKATLFQTLSVIRKITIRN